MDKKPLFRKCSQAMSDPHSPSIENDIPPAGPDNRTLKRVGIGAAVVAIIIVALGVAFALAYLFSPRHGLVGTRVAAARRRRLARV